MRPRRTAVRALGVLGMLGLAIGALPRTSSAGVDPASRAQAEIGGLDFDDARHTLAAADGNDPRVLLERARLAIYELDCDGAADILARPEVQRADVGDQLADIAHGCQRVTAALTCDRDPARGIEVRWQDEHDRPLAPLLFDTVAKARDILTHDLGVDWPLPTRIVVVRDLLSLAAMTGLPYSSAQTTGTVAVAKWGRVTLLSPRASHHGYSWRDTVTHELTHLAVTRASRDRAPLWLQEGVAKREEVRWRDRGPFDDRPPAEALVQRGLELHLAVPLDKLGPSIAMLPSADAAMVAFAEVTSFVRFYAQTADGTGGESALRNLLAQFRDGKGADEALSSASGADLKEWDTRWRDYVTSRPPVALPSLLALGSRHETPRDVDRLRDLHDRARLAQLLMARNHPAEALAELDRIELARAPVSNEGWGRAMGDPSLRWLRARALEEVARRQEGAALFDDPAQVLSSYGPWWATRGRWARFRGDEPTADSSFEQAVAADPWDPEVACESLDRASTPADPSKGPLCVGARAAAGPPYDSD